MADRYWVGGTGNWDGTAGTKWASTSGGTGGESVPTASDDVYFDANSGAVTVTVGAVVNCLDLNFTGFTGTFTKNSTINLYGSLTFVSGMTFNDGGTVWSIRGSGTQNITSADKIFTAQLNFFGGGTASFQDDLTSNSLLTFSTKTIVWNDNKLVKSSGPIIAASPVSIYDLECVSNLQLLLEGNITVTNSCVIESAGGQKLVLGGTGNPPTLTVNGSLTVSNLVIQRLAVGGTADWDFSARDDIADFTGNTGITFSTPINCYWVGNGGNWDDSSKWASTSGGTGGTARVPLTQDFAIFDENSFSSGSQTVIQNRTFTSGFNWSGVTNNPTFTTSTSANIVGSVILDENMVLSPSTQSYNFFGSGFFKCAGKQWNKGLSFQGDFTLEDDLLQNNTSTLTIVGSTGANPEVVFDTDNNNLTIGSFVSQSGNRLIKMGSGVWEITRGNTNPLTLTGNPTIEGTPLIKFTGTLTGNRTANFGGNTVYDVENDTSGSFYLNISGNNTFNTLKINAGRDQRFANNSTQTVTHFIAVGTSGNEIVLDRLSAGVFNLIKTGGSKIQVEYCVISNSSASPSNTWYAVDSTDDGGNTGWVFSAVPDLVISGVVGDISLNLIEGAKVTLINSDTDSVVEVVASDSIGEYSFTISWPDYDNVTYHAVCEYYDVVEDKYYRAKSYPFLKGD